MTEPACSTNHTNQPEEATMADEPNGADVLVEHLTECVKPDAALVVDGNADEMIATLLAAGWTYDGNVEYVAGKRIRNLVPPPEVAARLAAARDGASAGEMP